MTSPQSKTVSIAVGNGIEVSGLVLCPVHANACLALAHGAGAGMRHAYMEAVADQLAARGIATLRYQFPYMEQHRNRPDPPALCHATVRAAVAKAHDLLPMLPLFAGGKSFGGRMTSQTQASAPLPHVRGIVFLGFPLHPPKQPSVSRGKHLFEIKVPLLFLQGTRDALADLSLLEPLTAELGRTATLIRCQDADHSFHVPARSGRNDGQVLSDMLDAMAAWMSIPHPSRGSS